VQAESNYLLLSAAFGILQVDPLGIARADDFRLATTRLERPMTGAAGKDNVFVDAVLHAAWCVCVFHITIYSGLRCFQVAWRVSYFLSVTYYLERKNGDTEITTKTVLRVVLFVPREEFIKICVEPFSQIAPQKVIASRNRLSKSNLQSFFIFGAIKRPPIIDVVAAVCGDDVCVAHEILYSRLRLFQVDKRVSYFLSVTCTYYQETSSRR